MERMNEWMDEMLSCEMKSDNRRRVRQAHLQMIVIEKSESRRSREKGKNSNVDDAEKEKVKELESLEDELMDF